MQRIKENKNTWLFLGFLLLAGFANLFSRTGVPEWDTLMACINYVIYIGLLLFWIEAVRFRLLPSRARTTMLCAAFLMLLYMQLRIFKYRFAVSVIPTRYAIYAYWIPQMLIPALFLITCIRIRYGSTETEKWKENLILIPSVILVILVMTNDLHTLVYVPRNGLSGFIVDTGTYSYGHLFYLMSGWMIVPVLLGLGLLFREKGLLLKNEINLLTVAVSLWFGLILLMLLVIDRLHLPRMFNIPEIHIFSMLGIFEICIRNRLIPYNENYSGFFRKLRTPSVITDREFRPVYSSEAVLPADQNTLEAALRASVSLTPDLKLFGKSIRAGYAFWVEDESAVHRAQQKLLEANELIEQENDLIRAETEQKEKDAYLQSRHRIYHEIAEELYPCQKRITQILNGAVPETDTFKEKIAVVSVLNAYVKRKTNLLLLASENETLSINELFLALQESAYYLTLAGLQTTARETEERQMPAGVVIALYDAFESTAEQLIGRAPSLMVSWNGDGLRLAAETESEPELSELPLLAEFRRNEDVLYIDIPARKGGETA